jgi:hypothetical protein
MTISEFLKFLKSIEHSLKLYEERNCITKYVQLEKCYKDLLNIDLYDIKEVAFNIGFIKSMFYIEE